MNAVHSLLNSGVSNLIVSLKLALYGASIESLSLLRVALEPITVMAWRIEKGMFHEHVTFNKAKQQIRAWADVKTLYDGLSKRIVHLGNGANKFRQFKLREKTYPSIGMSIDTANTRLVLGELMRAALYVARVISDLYNTKREVVGEEYFNRLSELESKYLSLSKPRPAG